MAVVRSTLEIYFLIIWLHLVATVTSLQQCRDTYPQHCSRQSSKCQHPVMVSYMYMKTNCMKTCGLCTNNVLLNRPTNQSSTFLHAGVSYGSSRVVDGDSSGNLSTCSVTESVPDAKVSWWCVDMGQQQTVFSLRIYNRDMLQERLARFQVHVGHYGCSEQSLNMASLCYEDNSDGRQNIYDVQCDTPTAGQFLFISVPRSEFLTLCEVELAGCSLGYYESGSDRCEPCTEKCSSAANCLSKTICQQDCPQEKHGFSCDKNCPLECNNGCERWSGLCTEGCKAGRYGNTCNKTCPKCQNHSCDQQTGMCKHGCISGHWGDWCTETCPSCRNQSCDQHTGNCQQGYISGHCRDKLSGIVIGLSTGLGVSTMIGLILGGTLVIVLCRKRKGFRLRHDHATINQSRTENQSCFYEELHLSDCGDKA